jgi:hypothetical protein
MMDPKNANSVSATLQQYLSTHAAQLAHCNTYVKDGAACAVGEGATSSSPLVACSYPVVVIFDKGAAYAGDPNPFHPVNAAMRHSGVVSLSTQINPQYGSLDVQAVLSGEVITLDPTPDCKPVPGSGGWAVVGGKSSVDANNFVVIPADRVATIKAAFLSSVGNEQRQAAVDQLNDDLISINQIRHQIAVYSAACMVCQQTLNRIWEVRQTL